MMKRIVCLAMLLLLLSGARQVQAQDEVQAQNEIPGETRIYVWDVTLSLQGYDSHMPDKYNPEMDIYDDVVNCMIHDIEGLLDQTIEITILPFQEGILDVKQAKATPEGKQELVEWIKDCKKRFVEPTYTNIVGPIKEVKEKYLKKNATNRVILLTDGGNSEKFGGKAALEAVLDGWVAHSGNQDNFFYYVLLTEEARKNKPKTDNPGVEIVEKIPHMVNLTLPTSLHFNIKDRQNDPKLTIAIGCKQDVEISPDLSFAITTDAGAPISFTQTVSPVDKKIELTCTYDYNTLHHAIEEESVETLHIKLLNPDQDIDEHTVRHYSLDVRDVTVKLINKAEKTLTIRMKK